MFVMSDLVLNRLIHKPEAPARESAVFPRWRFEPVDAAADLWRMPVRMRL